MRTIVFLLPLLLCSIFLLTFKTATELSATTAVTAAAAISNQTHQIKDFATAFKNGCNLFHGQWVLEDPRSRPLYTEESCPYLTRQVTCTRNGRPDSLYQQWRWKPHACDLPNFDASMLLHSLRNKRLMFVGDSIQRTQWESMVCLVQSVVPDANKLVYKAPPRKVFVAKEFNASIEFYWAPFIVESNSDHATKHRIQRRVVRLDGIANHSRHWEGVDVLVFESYVWWMNQPLINATTTGSCETKEYNAPTAYRLALQTWTRWIESTLNPRTQKAFFVSLSPTHLWSWEWRPGSKGNCHNETNPIKRRFWGAGSSQDMMKVAEDALSGMKRINVTFLNITQLSEYCKDGHTSIFTERRGKLLTREQKAEANMYADCIHWCLPGVPHTWNEILYAYILYDHRRDG